MSHVTPPTIRLPNNNAPGRDDCDMWPKRKVAPFLLLVPYMPIAAV